MPTCENCQVVFKLPEQPVEITSTRVLCAKCDREYRAEKAKRLAAKAAGSSAGAASRTVPATHAPAPASAVTRPVPASVPIAVSHKTQNLAAMPARVEAPAPRAPHARPAAAVEAAPKAKLKPKPEAEEAPKKRSRDVERGTELIKQRSNRMLMIVWIIAGVMLAVAGVVTYFVREKDAREKAESDAHIAMVKAFKTKFDAYDIAREQDALAAIAYAEQNTVKWKNEDIEGDVQNRVAKAKTNVEVGRERGSLFEKLAAIEKIVDDPASDTRLLTDTRRDIEQLVPKAELVGTEFSVRLSAARAKIVRAVAVGLHEEARAAAADPSNMRGALAKYARAEEEIKPLMDEAYKSGNKDGLDFFLARYKEIIKESDALSAALFTPEVIEKTPWKDLLSGSETWLASENVPGFEHRIEKGVLQIVGPDASSGKKGVMSVGDSTLWRDFVLEFEFTLDKGQIDMFLRLPPGTVPDQTIEVITLASQGESAFVAGETYSVELSVIGSTETYTVHSVEFKPVENLLKWNLARKGSILFAVPENTAVKFSKMRIRELR